MNLHRVQIVQSALPLFLKHGFTSLKMEEIAKSMSISKKTLYKHFKNKEELILASTDYMSHYFSFIFDSFANSGISSVDIFYDMKKFLDDALGFEKQVRHIQQLNQSYPKIAAAVSKNYADVMGEIYIKISKIAIKEGYLDEKIDPNVLGYLSSNIYITLQLYVDYSKVDFDEVFDNWFFTMVKGLYNKEGRKHLEKHKPN